MVKKREGLPGDPRLNGYFQASEAWPEDAVVPEWCKATKELEREYKAGVEDFKKWAKTDIGKRSLGRRRR